MTSVFNCERTISWQLWQHNWEDAFDNSDTYFEKIHDNCDIVKHLRNVIPQVCLTMWYQICWTDPLVVVTSQLIDKRSVTIVISQLIEELYWQLWLHNGLRRCAYQLWLRQLFLKSCSCHNCQAHLLNPDVNSLLSALKFSIDRIVEPLKFKLDFYFFF